LDKEYEMKKVTMALMGLLVSSSLYAENYSEGKKFLGLEIGAAEIQGGVYLDPFDAASFDPMFEGSDITFGIRLGAQNDNYRTTLLFDYYDNTDEDQALQLGLVTLDYFVLSQDAASVTVKPFIGINLGYMRYESTLVDEDGIVYGGQAGVVANVAENIDIDLSYRYSLAMDSITMDHFGAVILGINYIY